MNRRRLVGKPRRSDRVMPDELDPECLAANLGLRRLRNRVRARWEDLVADLDRLSRRDRGVKLARERIQEGLVHPGWSRGWPGRLRRRGIGSAEASWSAFPPDLDHQVQAWSGRPCLPEGRPCTASAEGSSRPSSLSRPGRYRLGRWYMVNCPSPPGPRFQRVQGKSRSPTAVFRSRIALRWRIKASRYARTYSL